MTFNGPFPNQPVLVVGDATNGHNVVGPFDSPEASLAWYEAHPSDEMEPAHPAHISPPE